MYLCKHWTVRTAGGAVTLSHTVLHTVVQKLLCACFLGLRLENRFGLELEIRHLVVMDGNA